VDVISKKIAPTVLIVGSRKLEEQTFNTDSFDNMLELMVLFYYKMVVKNNFSFIA